MWSSWAKATSSAPWSEMGSELTVPYRERRVLDDLRIAVFDRALRARNRALARDLRRAHAALAEALAVLNLQSAITLDRGSQSASSSRCGSWRSVTGAPRARIMCVPGSLSSE